MTTCIRVLSVLFLMVTVWAEWQEAADAQSPKPAPRQIVPGVDQRPQNQKDEQRPENGLGDAQSSTDERPGGKQPAAGRPVAGPQLPPKIATKPTAPQAPFKLTADEETQLDRLLAAWQKKTEKIRKFRCLFTLYTYDATFAKDDGKPPEPKTEQGKLYYSYPDKGSYEITTTGGDHWICDGRAVIQYDQAAKKVIEHVLPPEMQGKSISEGPLPFLFGAEAERQKQRYYLRIITPEEVKKAGGAIWLEAFPRYQADAANFRRARIILDDRSLLPKALEIVDTNGQSRKSYVFEEVGVNELLAVGLWNNPFKADLPKGWTKEVRNPPPADAAPEGPAKPQSSNTARKPGSAAAQPKRK